MLSESSREDAKCFWRAAERERGRKMHSEYLCSTPEVEILPQVSTLSMTNPLYIIDDILISLMHINYLLWRAINIPEEYTLKRIIQFVARE